MRDAYELNGKGADIDHVSRLYAMQQHIIEQIVFFELAFSQSGGEVRTVDRNVESLQQVGQRAQVVFVTMSEDYRRNVVAKLVEKAEIRNGNVYAVSSLLRKAHPGVENQHLVAVAHRHAIHSKLADTTKWDDLKDTSHKSQEYSTCHLLTRMTRIHFRLYYPQYDDQTDTGPGYSRLFARNRSRADT